jgi:Ca2+/Na+ antiporter
MAITQRLRSELLIYNGFILIFLFLMFLFITNNSFTENMIIVWFIATFLVYTNWVLRIAEQ